MRRARFRQVGGGGAERNRSETGRLGCGPVVPSVVEQERPPSFAERRGFPIPLLEKRRKRSAVDGQSDLVGSRQPVDRRAPRELLPMLPPDFVDQQQRR